MITLLGKVLRKLRIDKGLLLADMASKFKFSSAYLSSIELGKRDIPDNFEENIINSQIFTTEEVKDIKNAIDGTRKSFVIRPKNDNVREIVAGFARNADNLSEEQIKRMFEIINERGDVLCPASMVNKDMSIEEMQNTFGISYAAATKRKKVIMKYFERK